VRIAVRPDYLCEYFRAFDLACVQGGWPLEQFAGQRPICLLLRPVCLSLTASRRYFLARACFYKRERLWLSLQRAQRNVCRWQAPADGKVNYKTPRSRGIDCAQEGYAGLDKKQSQTVL
jgi:hypothetical protein